MKCPECTSLREERAAIHEFDGKADREIAEIMAFFEKCMEHSLEVLDNESPKE